MFTSKRNLVLILLVATIFAYASSLGNPFIWDDEQFITSNAYVWNFDVAKIFTTNTIAGAGVQSNYYRPLTTLSFAIDAKIWSFGSAQDKGLNSFGFHVVNLLLHMGAGVVLFFLLEELFRICHSEASAEESQLKKDSRGMMQDARKEILRFTQDDRTKTTIASFFIALFFLIHPIQTEAVTYINSRGDSLYTLFLFASLWVFSLLIRENVILRRQPKNLLGQILRVAQDDKIRISLTVLLFLCSLLSKEIALAGVGLYIVFSILYLVFSKSNPTTIKYKILHTKYLFLVSAVIVLVVLIYLVLRLTVLDFGNTLNFYQGVHNEYTQSLAIRLFTFAKVLWIYLGLLVWPNPLHMERTVALVKSFFSPWVVSAISLILGIGILGVWQALKKHNPWILFGLLWFLVMLVPASGIVPINGILYEHWLYVPMVGFFIMLYGIIKFSIFNFQFSINVQKTIFKILVPFAVLISFIYIALTIHQNNLWADPIGFYTYTLSFAPNSARLHNNLGMSLASLGKNQEAIKEYEKALALGPGYPQIYNNVGNAQMAIGAYKDAEKNLKKALELAPEFGVARINLVKLYVITKQWKKAEEEAAGNDTLLQEVKRIEAE